MDDMDDAMDGFAGMTPLESFAEGMIERLRAIPCPAMETEGLTLDAGWVTAAYAKLDPAARERAAGPMDRFAGLMADLRQLHASARTLRDEMETLLDDLSGSLDDLPESELAVVRVFSERLTDILGKRGGAR